MTTPALRRTTGSEMIRSTVGEDGYTLLYRVWPSPGPPLANILLLNGMMSHSGWFRELARSLTELNLNVVGADRRGSGLNKAARGDAPSRQLLISDLLRIARSEERQLPTFVVGWCWGSILAVNFALEAENRASGLALLAPGIFPSAQIRRFVKSELQGALTSEWESPVLASPLSAEMFSDRPSIQNFIHSDALAQLRFTPRFFQISSAMSLVATTRLSQLAKPVLVLLAEKDVTADNQATDKALARIRSGLLTRMTLNCHHGMQFEAFEQIVANIGSWLQEQGIPVHGSH